MSEVERHLPGEEKKKRSFAPGLGPVNLAFGRHWYDLMTMPSNRLCSTVSWVSPKANVRQLMETPLQGK